MSLTLADPGTNRLRWFATRLARYYAVPNTNLTSTQAESILNGANPEDA